MIEQYLAASRRTRPADARLEEQYATYYGWIADETTAADQNPALFVTFSSDRKCELIRIGTTSHLVYDQYLGQSFNRLNRIQFAAHGASQLSQAYASKYVAERLLCFGHAGPAAFFAAASHQFERGVKEEGDPFDVPMALNVVRGSLTAVQEIFVIAHELAHYRWQRDNENLREEIRRYADEFIGHNAQIPKAEEQASTNRYRETFEHAPPEFLEELFADDFGALIAFRVAISMGIPAWQAAAGAVLAFKYLRLFRHLELVARRIVELTAESDPKAFKHGLAELKNDIWDEPAGVVGEYQFREHFIRHRLRQARLTLPSQDADDEGAISELIGEYDEKTEFPVVLGLVDRLEESLTLEVMTELTEQMGRRPDAVALVDRLTGWAN